ncbi:MAG: VCBS repeat-containing protein, partial [Verrucomicrobia bacterium]|nr:VCBS repeat-containing protein [Verrucomicrobiota bacterium]
MSTLMASFLAWISAVSGANSPVWHTGDGCRWSDLSVPAQGHTGFTLLPGAMTGISFTNILLESEMYRNQNLLNGSGVALGDVDGDGWIDIYLCNLNGRSVLYKNLGNWRFQDVTAEAGLESSNQLARGAVLADVDGDGALDLLVSYSGKGVKLFRNDGHGHFRDAQASELAARTGSTSMALADIDGNGSLDLYVANYGENTIRSGLNLTTRMVGGREEVVGRYRNRIKIIDGKLVEFGEPHAVYLNDGQGHFQPLSWTDGAFLDEEGKPLARAQWDLGLSVMFRDINQDGYPDIYVCNDFENPDRIWINDGHGHFRAIARPALRHTSHFSMGVDFADLDRDGKDELVVADMLSRSHVLQMTQISPSNPPPAFTGEVAADRPQIRQNTLFYNRGDGTYAEIANYSGVAASEWSWCPVFLDVDLDGYEDLLVVNGHIFDTQDLDAIQRTEELRRQRGNQLLRVLEFFPKLLTPNLAFRNRGNLTFEEVGTNWGFDSRQVSHGIALADLDNDGDLDVVINCLNGPVLVYRNDTAAPRVAVRLKGRPPNTEGIGARIWLYGGAVPMQSQEMISGGRYMSSDAPERTFAAGSLTNRMRLEVHWRSGLWSRVNQVQANRRYEVDEAAARPRPATVVASPGPLFEDISERLGHTHTEDSFDDFELQPSLPRKLSQLGPGVAWCDVDGDGQDELVLGAGKGGTLAVYHADGHGGFRRMPTPALDLALPDDAAGIVGWANGTNGASVFVGLANYQSAGTTNQPAALRFDFQRGAVAAGQPLPGGASSSGPLAAADVDGDGALDLFLGGRVLAGQYPAPATSRLFLQRGGRLVPDSANDPLLSQVGLVSGAVFSDLDGDGWPDLILACEWGAVRIFHNDHGRLTEWNPPVRVPTSLHVPAATLHDLTGWWNSVATVDLDGDGRPDIVAGNWGLNSFYQAAPAGTCRIEYGDFNDDGQVEDLEAYADPVLNRIVPWRNLDSVAKALPWIRV